MHRIQSRASASTVSASHRTRGLLVALLVIVASLVLTASASAAPPHGEFVGTQAWTEPTVAQLDRLRNANVRSFRLQLVWGRVERTRPTGCDANVCTRHVYDWRRYDRIFARAAERGIRIMPYLLGSPSWATPNPAWPPVRNRRGYANWKRQAFYDFARAAARRYGVDGRLWRDSPGLTALPAQAWQVWNEPNLPNYWWSDERGGRVAREYAALLKRTAAYLRAGDPSARVVTAGMTTSSIASLPPGEFLRALFAVSGTSSTADFVGLHPYAPDPYGMMVHVASARRALNRTNAEALPLWVTEMGWSAGGPDRRYRAPGSTLAERERSQARYLRGAYRRLRSSATELGVHGAFWFSLADFKPPEATKDKWYHHTGVFRRDGVTPKLAWKAMRCVTGTGTCSY